MDPDAINYQPNATKPTANCVPKIAGCTLRDAPNWNPRANFNDGSCAINVCAARLHDCHIKADCIYTPPAQYTCQCIAGYDGDGRTTCVRRSSTLELFDCPQNGALRGFNLGTAISGLSTAVQCADLCDAEPRCLSFDWGQTAAGNKRCYLGNGTVGDHAELYLRGPVPRAGQYYQYYEKTPHGCGCGCIPGCTDHTRLGYNRDAFFDDGSCGDIKVPGCTNRAASNYNVPAGANYDDGSCHLSACTIGGHGCHANSTCVHITPYHNTTHSCVCNRGFSDTNAYDDQVICELDYEFYPVAVSGTVSITGVSANRGSCAQALRNTVAEVAEQLPGHRMNVHRAQQSIALQSFDQMLTIQVVVEGSTFSLSGRHEIRDAIEVALGGTSLNTCGTPGGVCAEIVGEPTYLPLDYVPNAAGRRIRRQDAPAPELEPAVEPAAEPEANRTLANETAAAPELEPAVEPAGNETLSNETASSPELEPAANETLSNETAVEPALEPAANETAVEPESGPAAEPAVNETLSNQTAVSPELEPAVNETLTNETAVEPELEPAAKETAA
jgi:hypothetical protein